MRCIIKTLKSKVLPLVLSVSLALGLCLSGSFAYSVGENTDIVSLVNSINLHQSAGDLHSVLLSYIKSHGADTEGYQYIFCSCSSTLNSFYTFQSDGLLYQAGNRYIYSTSSNDIYMAYLGNNRLDVPTWTLSWDNTTSVTSGLTFYRFRYPYDISTIPNDIWYANYSISTDLVDLLLLSNLDASGYVYNPDPRQVFCELSYMDSDTYGELPYIYVSTTDTSDFLNSYCYFEFTDARGSGQSVTILSSQYLNPHIVDSDYSSWIFSPNLISSYDFHLDSLTYYSLDFGSKTIELDIDVVYGEDYPLPDDYDYIYYFNNYFESHSNGALAYGVTNLGLTNIDSDGVITVNWVDMDSRLTCQNFEVKALFIPDFMTDDVLSMEQIYQLYEQYDVIFANVTQVFYNLLVGGNGSPYLALKDLYDNYGFDSALNGLIHTKFDCHSLPYEYLDISNSVFTVQVTPPCLFIVTRSFLLKRTLSALGDIDDRLLEFETALVGEDGLGVVIQEKLDNIFVQQNEYFTDISNFIRKLNYWLNDNPLSRIEGYLHDIWEATLGEFQFDYTLLPEPFESMFEYALGFFASSYSFFQDFKDVSDSSLYGDSLISLPFSYTPTTIPISLEPLSPTPIPLPTFIGGD